MATKGWGHIMACPSGSRVPRGLPINLRIHQRSWELGPGTKDQEAQDTCVNYLFA